MAQYPPGSGAATSRPYRTLRPPSGKGLLILALFMTAAAGARAQLTATLGLSVPSLNFGTQCVGSSSTPLSLTLTNNGALPLSIAGISLTGANAGEFTITAGGSSGLLAAHATQNVQVAFNPSTPSAKTANLVITGVGGINLGSVALTGTGNDCTPLLTLSVPSLSFGAQCVGVPSAPLSLTLTNAGTVPVNIAGISLAGTNAGAFSISAGGNPGTLAVGASQNLQVSFNPAAAGNQSANLVITGVGGVNLGTVTLSGTGNNCTPILTLGVPSLSFGTQCVGSPSAALTVNLSNTGTLPLPITGISINGGGGQFAISAGGSAGVLGIGASQNVQVTFTPTAAGNQAATLVITSVGGVNLGAVTLSGTGGIASVDLSPTSVSFGGQVVGGTSVAQTITLTNQGTVALTLNGATINGGNGQFTISAGGSAGSLAPGASATLQVAFSPTSPGAQNATLSLTGSSPCGPIAVTASLSGTGTSSSGGGGGGGGGTSAPAVGLSPSSLSFGDERVGTTSAAQTVTLTNSGTAPLTISSVTVTGANPGDYTITAGSGPGTLAPGESRTISVTFTPAAAGSSNASLSIVDNAAGSPHTVALSGNGTSAPSTGTPVASVSPTSLNFGDQPVGTVSGAQGVTLTNTGTAPLVVSGISIQGGGGQFAVTGVGSTGTLAPGASETISVTFAPTTTGPQSGTLVISTNAAGSPSTVALAGNGTTGAPAAGSDWPQFAHDARHLGLADIALDPRGLSPWNVSLGSRPGTSPVVLNGIAYVGAETGVFAIDTATATQRWTRALPAPVRSAPAATANVVVVSAGGLYGLNAADGAVLWQRPDIIAEDDVSPVLVNNTVYIGARGPGGFGVGMYAVNVTNGANVWPAPVPLPAGLDNRATAAVSPELGLLFVGLGPSPLLGRSATGPTAVAALRLADGAAAWSAPAIFLTSSPPAAVSVGWAANGTPAVFMAGGESATALDARSGTSLWTRTMPEPVLAAPPVVSSASPQVTTLYVGAASGRVYALSSATGADVPGGLLNPVAAITGTLALAGNTLFVPTATSLVAADVTTGAAIWSSPLAAGSGVAVAGSSPYVATTDGRFVGFKR